MPSALPSAISGNVYRYGPSWSPEFGSFAGPDEPPTQRPHGRLPIAPLPFSLVYGHRPSEKNCAHALRTHAPCSSTIIARALTRSINELAGTTIKPGFAGRGNDFALSIFIARLASKQYTDVLWPGPTAVGGWLAGSLVESALLFTRPRVAQRRPTVTSSGWLALWTSRQATQRPSTPSWYHHAATVLRSRLVERVVVRMRDVYGY